MITMTKFEDYADLFIRSRIINARTAQDYRILLRSLILPTWADVDLEDVKASDLRVWFTELWVKAPHQARRCRVIFRGIFELAEDDGLIDRNPAARLRLRTPPRGHPRVLTAAEIQRLIYSMPTERDRLVTGVLAYGGLRFGETAALSPHDVTGVGLSVHRSVQARHGGGWLWGDTKSHQRRQVNLPPGLLTDLQQWARSRAHHDLMFASKVETPIHRGNWQARVLTPACDRAGIQRIRPHDLRASCASLLASSGVPIAAASQHLGHSDTTVTMRHYLAADATASTLVTAALSAAESRDIFPIA